MMDIVTYALCMGRGGGGGSGTPHVNLTPEQYEQLTPEEKANGTEYFVYDSLNDLGLIYRDGHLFGVSSLAAYNVTYDNTTSQLQATNVQAAIDEIVAKTSNIHICLTQAAYDALPAATKMNGAEYFTASTVYKNDTVVQYNSNDEEISRTRIVGIIPREVIYAADEVTTAPALIDDMSQIDPTALTAQTCLLFETQIDDKTIYHTNVFSRGNQGTEYSSLNDLNFTQYATDIYASNFQFVINHDEQGEAPDTFEIADENGDVIGVGAGMTLGQYFVYNSASVSTGMAAVGYATISQSPVLGERRIYRNNVMYATTAHSGGGGGDETPHVDLTQAEYDLLTPAEKLNGTEYFITDAQAQGDFSVLENRISDVEDELDNSAGQKYYVSDVAKGEIFNDYEGNIASGQYSHAEGYHTYASGESSHAEGDHVSARGKYSHVEGRYSFTDTSSECAHAEGYHAYATGKYSHAEGYYTEATDDYSHASGKFNDFQSGDLFEIGNGTANNARSNIVEVSSTYLNVNGDIKKNGTAIGALAFKSSATGTALTSAGTLPSLTYDSVNNRLVFDAGTLPTSGTVTVS